LVAALALGPSSTASADDDGDRIAQLSVTLSTHASDKERISAVTALGRLGDKRALRPLVAALGDKSPTVRAIAATSLGKLGHRAALPSLKTLTTTDQDDLVRKQADTAVRAISAANGLAPDAATASASSRAGFGSAPRAVRPRPDLYVVLKSSNDESPGPRDDRSRVKNAQVGRTALETALLRNPSVTSAPIDAQRYGLDPQQVDLAITRLEQRVEGPLVEVEAEIRLSIVDKHGRMRSLLSGGAKVQVPRHSFSARYLPQMRRDAIENAVKGIFDNLLAHLRRDIS
jgi:hypothetical protein